MTNVVEFEHKVIPAGTKTDQELIDEGRAIVNKTGRELGEWFNEVKLNKEGNQNARKNESNLIGLELSAKQICAKAGVKYGTAHMYGSVVTVFHTVESQRGFTFVQCQKMLPIFNKLGAEKFERFMSDAVSGKTYLEGYDPEWVYTKPYCTKDIQRAKFYITRDLCIGAPVPEAEANVSIDAPVDTLVKDFKEGVMSTLPKKTQSKALSEMRKIIRDQERTLNKSFMDEVNRCVELKLTEERASMDAARKHLMDAQIEADSRQEQLRAMVASRKAIFTRQEYRLIRGCLVSDKQPEGQRRRFDDAMAIFTRLKLACDNG